jgi:membrane protein DedA with SNARE-associated domain
MHGTLEFLIHYGYWLLLGWVFVEQAGVPVPSFPLMLAAGALAGRGQMNLALALIACIVASLIADTFWYMLGRRYGVRILQLLCKISLEPDSCVRRTEGTFEKSGEKSLLFAKFVPGLSTVATPLAGIFHMRMGKFLLFDGLGAAIWAGSYLATGYIFNNQIEKIGAMLATMGGWAGLVVGGALGAYVGYKFAARQKFLHDLRVARITVDELKEKIDAGDKLAIVDLRHSLDFEADPETIPGALWMDASTLQKEEDKIPNDREVVLYCT